MGPTDIRAAERTGRSGLGFWVVAFAFATAMAFTTVPTPLWSLFAQRDRFSSLTVTIVFAVYALAVALSLFLAGHLSDWHGRRPVLMLALALEILAGVVFVVWPSLPGLLLARVLSGLGVGVVTATATAWLGELRGADGRAQVVATAANLGRLGLGALISGALAQWVARPLLVPFAAFAAALLLADTLHRPSHALAGAVAFAGLAMAACTQMLTGSRRPSGCWPRRSRRCSQDSAC